ncbi:hypothetical protein [Salinicoccus sp. YB14-2]|uniref:hypothetical protein n=1 Tax=Salinicoccus sp. YB14-2 TaxID=1572701 RepID=UPI00068E6818|nr:hypothetical protein [Salinicoccus sp. YB14-2]
MEGSSNKMDKRFIYSILLFIAIVLIGATLRSPISSVGPLVPFFSEELNISNTMVGFMNILQLVAFGLFSAFIPKISKKYGMEFTLMISMIVLTARILVRGAGTTFSLTIMFFVLRTRKVEDSYSLSGMAPPPVL